MSFARRCWLEFLEEEACGEAAEVIATVCDVKVGEALLTKDQRWRPEEASGIHEKALLWSILALNVLPLLAKASSASLSTLTVSPARVWNVTVSVVVSTFVNFIRTDLWSPPRTVASVLDRMKGVAHSRGAGQFHADIHVPPILHEMFNEMFNCEQLI